MGLVEHLEDRLLMATYSLSGGVLTVNGTSGADTIVASYIAGKVAVTVAPTGKMPSGKTYSAGSISKIVVNASGGNDRVTMMFVNFTKPLAVKGGAGNDTILCGSTRDSLYGGDGNDYLNGTTNNDRLEGGPGKDTLYGGSGNDVLVGGTGVDKLEGEAGNDTIDSYDTSTDNVLGGSGTDKVHRNKGDILSSIEGYY